MLKQQQDKGDNGGILFSIILLILCPALAIVSAIVHIYRGEYKHLTILSIAIAMVTLFTPPFADIYRHTLLYFSYGHYSWSGFIQTNEHDFIFYTLTHLFAQNNIPFEFISFIFVFTCYQISFYIFKDIIYSNHAKEWGRQTRFIVFVCFLLMVPFIAIVNGLRMATAAYFAVLGWYHMYNRKMTQGITIYIISCAIHFGSLLFFPIITLMILPNFKITNITYVIGIIIIMTSNDIILSYLPVDLVAGLEMEDAIDGYMINSEERFDKTMSINGRIAMFLERMPLLIIGIILFNSQSISDRDKTIGFIVVWLAFLYYPYTVLFQRYAFGAIPILIYLTLHAPEVNINHNYQLHKIIAFSCIVMTAAYLYGYREPAINTKYYKMFYPSIYTIPTVDTQENFRDALIPKA